MGMEWLLESYDPASEDGRPRWIVIFRFALAVAFTAAFGIWAMPWLLNESGIEPWAVWLLLGVYLLACFFVRPRIDSGDLQDFDFYIDNLLSRREDSDRVMLMVTIALALIFFPGRIVTRGAYEFALLIRGAV